MADDTLPQDFWFSLLYRAAWGRMGVAIYHLNGTSVQAFQIQKILSIGTPGGQTYMCIAGSQSLHCNPT